jgi:hypothetical protein
MARIQFGVNENTPYLYYGIGDLMAIAKRKQQQVDELRMAGLNDSRKAACECEDVCAIRTSICVNIAISERG